MPDHGILKYHVKLRFEVDGVVERPDVVGAVFGQTEGLFGPELNLNELQKTWKVGRIDIRTESKNGQTKGQVLIPMSTDISTAALMAAAIENIDKVGPCKAHFQLSGIEDIREIKKKAIADRAKNIVIEWTSKTSSESEEIRRSIEASAKPSRIIQYGKENLPAGSGVYSTNPIFIVEGRADVLVLLKSGYENVVAIDGTKIPYSIIRLGKEKDLIALLDGDRSGDLIQKELNQVTNIKQVLRAPKGKEVEELTPVEIRQLIEPAKPVAKIEPAKPVAKIEPAKPVAKIEPAKPTPISKVKQDVHPKGLINKIKEMYPRLNSALEAVVLDAKLNEQTKVPVNELVASLENVKDAKYVIFDGIVTQRLTDACGKAGVSYVVGHRTGEITNKPTEMKLVTFKDLGIQ